MPSYFIKPTWEHASSRFMCVTQGVIDVLQAHFFNQINLDGAIPDLSEDAAEVIVAESLEADRFWNLPPDQLLSGYAKGPEGDFKSAVLAELMFEGQELARQRKIPNAESNLWAIAMAKLEGIARSPTASPLLWYEDIYLELAQGAQQTRPGEALDWHKHSLAHNLHFHQGNNGISILRDVADSYLAHGDLERGLQMLTALLHHAPDDIWTYNLMAITFDRYGLTQLGKQAVQRGLQYIDATGNKDQLRDQLERCMIEMQTSSRHGREAEIDPQVIAALQAALALDFEAGEAQPVGDLCRALVPDLDQIPVKRPLKPADMPLPDRETMLRLLSETQTAPAKKKTHRSRRKSRRPSS